MFQIQWYDPWDRTRAGNARKDGKPVGIFETRQAAETYAEQEIEKHGAWDCATYKIVPKRAQPRKAGSARNGVLHKTAPRVSICSWATFIIFMTTKQTSLRTSSAGLYLYLAGI